MKFTRGVFLQAVHAGLLLSLQLIPCNFITAQSVSARFTNVALKSGIDFKYTIGDDSYVNILESSGSGITVFDYNNDRLMDILFLNGTYLEGISDREGKKYMNSHDRLYRNEGKGRFSDVTREAGLIDVSWSEAAVAVDYDYDGDQDLFLLNYGPNRFFRNNGNGTFTDISSQTGLKGPERLNGFTKWSIGASFWDFNGDGLLDVMVGNFLAFDPAYVSSAGPGIMPHPSEYRGQPSMLYVQQPGGFFADHTEKAGLSYPDSKCMGLTVLDYDQDGDLDIFQANDHHFNYLFRRDGDRFTEVAREAGVAANSKGVGTGSMHATPGDIDGDGLIDFLVTDLDYGAMYRNLGNGLFEDITEKSGIASQLAGKGSWGAALSDFDNDGDLDIVAANGTAEELILQHPVLLENDGKGFFRNAGMQAGEYFLSKRSGRGLAVTDYDNDGDIDIVVSHVDKDGSAVLLRNDGGNRNHWVGLYLIGTAGSHIGAKVTVSAGGRRQVAVNQNSKGYLSNNDPRLHFGLGSVKHVDLIEVLWTNGKREVYRDIEADKYLIIREGKGIERY